MNPSSPLPNPPSFTSLPQNPNPRPTFFHPIPQNPPHTDAYTSSSPSPAPILPHLLPSTLSALKDVISISESTINSLSHHLTNLTNPYLCSCPFNLLHRMPPESLFRHTLHCPSSNATSDDGSSVFDSIQYPMTHQSEADLRAQNHFHHRIDDSGSELCFSLDDYVGSASNFFYRDCPGVVSSVHQDRVAKRTFTLPGVLLKECANVIRGCVGEVKDVRRDCMRLFPSELWAVNREIEAWNDYPSMYSYCVLQVILHSQMVNDADLLKWVILKSMRYGVVIDQPLGDHILVLFRLCSKAICNEAIGLAEVVVDRGSEGKEIELTVTAMSFRCPILIEVLSWFASELAVLYGEANAKFLTGNLLKQCLFKSAMDLMLFSSEQYDAGCPNISEISQTADGDHKSDEFVGKNKQVIMDEVARGDVYVSQVAAAVAALQERSLLEWKIKTRQFSQPYSTYQRMCAHADFSKKAHEERQNRSDYRPILEHDGLCWNRSNDKETNKTKTKEELLAEERDYKRRRMSYRGKKLKRTTTEVMRYIIDDHMEEIKQAGGIGCFLRGTEKVGLSSGKFLSHNVTSGAIEAEESAFSLSKASAGLSDYRRQPQTDYHINYPRFQDVSHKDLGDWERNTYGHDQHVEKKRIDKDRRDRQYTAESPEKHRSYGRLHELVGHQGEQKYVEKTRSKHYEMNQRSSNQRDGRSRSYSKSNSTIGKHNHESDTRDRHWGNICKPRRSDSASQYSIDDRYDPSDPHDMYLDDSVNGK